jgi:dTDP-4-amino-4,6-dideoxygalactose transaminase
MIINALRAEGVDGLMVGYQNIHLLPLFREQLTFKNNSIPYSLLSRSRARELRIQKLPVAERLHNSNFIGLHWCAFELSNKEVDKLIEAFVKVWTNLSFLR